MKNRRQFLKVAGSALALAATPAFGQTSPSLGYSTSSDRSNNQALNGATISGTVYIFVRPTSLDVGNVRFFLDGLVVRDEGNPPYDFAGGTATVANPFNANTLSDGQHTIEARWSSGSVNATFTKGGTTTTTQGTTTTQPPSGDWSLTFNGRKWRINGVDLPVDGLPRNVRLVQAVADFTGKVNGWDANANTDAFIAALGTFKNYSIEAITINMQGGNPGDSSTWGENYNNSTFNADGSMKQAYKDRLTRVLNAMTDLRIVPIVGIFYQRQDQILSNEAAVKTACNNAINFLAPWKNQIVVEVANECNVSLYQHAIIKKARIRELVKLFRDAGYHAGFSTSSGVPTTSEVGTGNVILLHGNDKTDQYMTDTANLAKSRFPGKPALFNEDGASAGSTAYSASRYISHMNRAINADAGWGLHDAPEYQYIGPVGTTMTKLSWEPTSAKTKEVLTAMKNLG